MTAIGPELAFEQTSLRVQRFQNWFDDAGVDRKSLREFVCRKGAVSTAIASNDFEQRIGRRPEPDVGESGRKWHAQRVAITRGIFDRYISPYARDGDIDDAPSGVE